MKILIFSDTHGAIQPMLDAVHAEAPDHVIHLGDHIRDADALAEIISCPVIRIAGNCDFMDLCSDHLVLEFGGVRLFLTHGHKYGVKTNLLRLTYAAMEAGANAALFGHTHCRLNQEHDGIILFNPGSCGHYAPTYGVLHIVDGAPSFDIKTMDRGTHIP